MKTRRVIPCFTTCVNTSSHNIQIWTGRASSFTRTPKYEFLHIFASFSYLSAGNGDGLIEDHFHGPGKEGPCQIVVSCFRETETNPSKRQAQQPHLSQKTLKKDKYEYRICFTIGPRGERAHPCRAPQKDAARPGGRLGLFDSWNECANMIMKKCN